MIITKELDFTISNEEIQKELIGSSIEECMGFVRCLDMEIDDWEFTVKMAEYFNKELSQYIQDNLA